MDPKWPDEPPFQPDDFERFDESKDTVFYSQVTPYSIHRCPRLNF
jgi:hypothetical protein